MFLFLVIFSIFAGANVLAVSVNATPKPTNVNSFELFWPIVAGKVQGDNLYPLKIFKEKVRGSLIFSKLRKAEYYSVLSQKRLIEFEKLILTDKNYENATKTLDVLKNTQEKTVYLVGQAKKEGSDISSTSQIIIEAFEKEELLMKDLLDKIDPAQKEKLRVALSNLTQLISGLK